MTLLSKLISSTATQSIDALSNILDKLFIKNNEKLQAQAFLEKLKQNPAALQVALNKLEANNKSIFISGWRPFIGWVCGLGLANTFIINPWLQWMFNISGPQVPLDVMLELVIAMLGLGTLRTIEKIGGRTR